MRSSFSFLSALVAFVLLACEGPAGGLDLLGPRAKLDLRALKAKPGLPGRES